MKRYIVTHILGAGPLPIYNMHSIKDCELRTQNYTEMYTAKYTAIDSLDSTDYLYLFLFFTSVKLPFFVFTKTTPAILLPTLLLPQNDPSSFIFTSRKELAGAHLG